jgi:hypothetical protein
MENARHECKYCLRMVVDLKRHLRTCPLTPISLGNGNLTPERDARYVAQLRAEKAEDHYTPTKYRKEALSRPEAQNNESCEDTARNLS